MHDVFSNTAVPVLIALAIIAILRVHVLQYDEYVTFRLPGTSGVLVVCELFGPHRVQAISGGLATRALGHTDYHKPTAHACPRICEGDVPIAALLHICQSQGCGQLQL